jgi:hypothetical protein
VRYTPAIITTAIMLGLTVWLLIGRFKVRRDSNWPLFYYFALIGYHQGFKGELNSYAIYAAVVAALFYRFEFVGGWFNYLLRGVEMGVLLYLIYTFFHIVFG